MCRGVFVVSGRDSAPLFESVEATLDRVSLAVEVLAERWRPTAGRAFGFAAFDLVRALGNGVPDPS